MRMVGQQRLLTVATCLLFLATLCPTSEARRGGGFGRSGGFGGGWGGSSRGGGGYPRQGGGTGYRPMPSSSGQAYRPMPAQSGGSSGSSARNMAGAAAAGAVGGAMLGSALSRPGYGGGYGGYGGGYGGYGGGYGGYPRAGGYGPRPSGYEGPEGSGDMGYYYGASSGPIYNSIIVIIGSLMSLVMGYWVGVM